MKKEVLLEQMVDMMSAINEVVIKEETDYYWYDTSSGKLDSDMLTVARKAMQSLDMAESDILAKLNDKIYVSRSFNDQNQIVLTAYLTSPGRKVTRPQVKIANANKSGKTPRFAQGKPVRLGELRIDIVPGKTKVAWLQVGPPADTLYENKVLKKLKQQFADLGVGTSNPSLVEINGVQYRDVVGVYPAKRNAPADFVLKTKKGDRLKVIRGSGISYKKAGFERYVGIARSSDKYNKEIDESISNRFIDLVRANWQKYSFLKENPPGFVSKVSIPNQELIYLLYGDHEFGEPGNWRSGGVSNSEHLARHIMIGDMNLVENPDGGFSLTSDYVYNHGQIPDGDLQPVLYSRIGGGGSKVPVQEFKSIPGIGQVPVAVTDEIKIRIFLAPMNRAKDFIEIQ